MRLDWRMPQMHWPNMRREQAERVAVGTAGLLAALLLIGGLFALFTDRLSTMPEIPALMGMF